MSHKKESVGHDLRNTAGRQARAAVEATPSSQIPALMSLPTIPVEKEIKKVSRRQQAASSLLPQASLPTPPSTTVVDPIQVQSTVRDPISLTTKPSLAQMRRQGDIELATATTGTFAVPQPNPPQGPSQVQGSSSPKNSSILQREYNPLLQSGSMRVLPLVANQKNPDPNAPNSQDQPHLVEIQN